MQMQMDGLDCQDLQHSRLSCCKVCLSPSQLNVQDRIGLSAEVHSGTF